MGSTVFAVSDYEGYFEELVMINNDQIIEFLWGDEYNVNSVRVMDDGKEDTWFYIDLVEIK